MLRKILRNKRIAICSSLLGLVILTSVMAPIVSPYDPLKVFSGLRNAPIGTDGHIFGTDQSGRDILSRLIWGARVTLVMSTIPVMISMVAGILLGLIAAYYGGLLEFIVLRIMEVLFAFPVILLAILAAQILGKGIFNAMAAMTIVVIPYVIRATHASAKSTIGLTYIEASTIRGAGARHIMFSEILPNIVPPMIIFAAALLPIFVIFSAGLSYFGLAIEPPTPEWGIMIAEGQQVIQVAPHVPIVPGLALLFITVSMNLIADGLQDTLRPQAKGERQ